MSTFEGRMKEYRLVSIDRFDGENLSSTVYFLSHIHTDHTVGLDQNAFFEKLKQRGNTYLYCSEITRILLLGNTKKYGHLVPYIKSLEILCPTTIDIPAACPEDQNSTVLVTLLPAAHCLGSVMFLFEGDEGNVLYTGDFRWGMSEATQMQYLDPKTKPLRSVYIDTTFCIPKAFYIPSRKQCEDGVISLVDSHFQEYGQNGHIWIESRTNFGHETLLKEISLHTKMKIHVADWKKELYDEIPSLKDFFTVNPEETRIHAHPRSTFKRFSTNALPCGYVPLNKIKLIQIRPSTMWFTTLPEIRDIVQQDKVGLYRACYSFHSSYSEIRDLIQYLKPARVFPNVIPANSKTYDEIQKTLNSFLTIPHYKDFSSVESEERPLGIMKIPSKLSKESLSVEDCVFDDTPNMSGNSQERTSLPNSQSENGQEETSIQNSQSSYDGSHKSDSELNLYSSVESQMNDQSIENLLPLCASVESSSSLPMYIEDNSDDSEYEDEVSHNEHFKLPKVINSSKSEDKNEKSAERLLKVPEDTFSAEKDEERKINGLSGSAHLLMSGAGDNKQEHKKEQDVLGAANISNVSDSSNGQGEEMEENGIKMSNDRINLEEGFGDNKQEHKKEQGVLGAANISNISESSNEEEDKTVENCIKRSKDRINLEDIFGSQNSFFQQLNNSESSSPICQDENVFVSSKNLGDTSSVPEADRPRPRNMGETDTINSYESFKRNPVDSIEEAKAVDIYDRSIEKDPERDNLVMKQKENSWSSYNLKPQEFDRRLSSPTLSEKHGRNKKKEECSQEKYRKMDLSLKSVNSHQNKFPSDRVEMVADKKEVLELEAENIFQKANCNKENPIRSPKRFAVSAASENQENNQLMKCNDPVLSFNTKTKNHQNLNSKDRILQAENFGNKIPSVDSCPDTNIQSKTCDDTKELKLSQESTKTDTSIEILKIIPKNPSVIEISDSEDDCIAIDSDSDETLPPSPGALESSQELFSSFDAINDKSNVSDSSDGDVVVIETRVSIQNGNQKFSKKTK